ncbi:quinoprotein relay system zinc metallohydrolase 1 [Primorskyibacter sp. S187A]|uniref:quinoprotein relay system zinc metallohydrolase 1 n=1 Tax=Primorskyibacter sp. S187A TaxID=3415130 RepID=UPI003C7D07BC
MPLTRRKTLGLLAAASALPVPAMARMSYALEPRAVADGVWMIEGAREYFSMENGGAIVNIALLKGDTGMIVIDTGPSLRYGEALRDAIRRIDLRGPSVVINTHHHPDHFFGNIAFASVPKRAIGATILAAQSEGDGFSDNMYRLLGDWMRGTEVIPPSEVIEGGEIVIDGRAFQALPLAGHTDGDLALIDQTTGILIAGDLAFLDRAPTTPHADLAQWQESLQRLSAAAPAAVLPGHGPFESGQRALQQTSDYLSWLDGRLREAARGGEDMVEIMLSDLPAQWAALGAMPQEFERSVAHLYPDLERTILPAAN